MSAPLSHLAAAIVVACRLSDRANRGVAALLSPSARGPELYCSSVARAECGVNLVAIWRFVPLLLLMLGLPPALALEQPAQRIITVVEPPASYDNEHGLAGGYATELVRALQQQVGDHSVIEVMPESRALLTAQQQANVLLFGFSRIASREQAFHWVMPLLHTKS